MAAHIFNLKQKCHRVEAGVMAQGDLSSLTVGDSGSNALFWPPGTLHHVVQIHPYKYKEIKYFFKMSK